MNKSPLLASNFAHLQEHDEQLLRLGMLAERYFPEDPNTSLLKLRQLAELLAQLVATQVGLYQASEESQYDLLRRLQDQSMLPREIAQLFGEVRRAGNAASETCGAIADALRDQVAPRRNGKIGDVLRGPKRQQGIERRDDCQYRRR